MASALDVQVSGNHYKQFEIQPIEFIMKNKLGFIEGNVIKYICRHQFKDKEKDLNKVKHYCDLLLELHYQIMPEEKPVEKSKEPQTWDLQQLADLVKHCLETYGEDAVENALEPVLDEWQANKPKDEEPEVVELREVEPTPPDDAPYVQEECVPEPVPESFHVNAEEPFEAEVPRRKEKKPKWKSDNY